VSAATCTLAAPGLTASFVPELAMVGCSLEHEGVELLVLNDGVEAYRERGSTFGVPLLHPWANRLARPLPASQLVHRDGNALPIHGVLPRVLPFTVTEQTGSSVQAEFDTHDHPAVLEVFPHPHLLTVAASLSAEALEIRTTLHAYGRRPVPIAFGYHPYLSLPGLPRPEWTVDIPARTRLLLDERMIPTGQREPVRIERAPLDGRSFDDAYTDLGAHPRFTLAGGGRTIGVEFLEGYDFAQVYAPADRELVCFEPMTAPTNAIASGDGLTMVRPGEIYTAAFRITVTDA
jgi:aldose 1-epimerase